MSELRTEDTGAEPEDLDLGPDPDIGDEPETELPEGGEEVEQPEPQGDQPQQQQRQGRRDQNARLRDQLRELRQKVAEQDAWRAGIETQRSQQQAPPPPDPNALAAQEQARWQQYEQAVNEGRMTPIQVLQQVARDAEQRMQNQFVTNQLTTRDQIDKQAYEARQATSKIHRDYAPRVEQMLRAERASGNLGVTRDAILSFLVGQDAIARAQTAAPVQRRQAAGRVAGQQARPTGARGDGAADRTGGRQPESAADEALLKGIRVGDI